MQLDECKALQIARRTAITASAAYPSSSAKGTTTTVARWLEVHDRNLTPRLSTTELAEDRTLLASERTFASWTRTSLGCIAVGVGFHALFSTLNPPWVPKAIASLFLLLAAVIVWLAARRATAVARRLDPHVVVSAQRVNLDLIASAVSLGAAALALAVWLLPVA